MNKSGLIDAISNTTSLTKREAENSVDALGHEVVSEVRAGRRVSLGGFDSFNPTQRGAKEIGQQVDQEGSSKGAGDRCRQAACRKDRQARSGHNRPSSAFR